MSENVLPAPVEAQETSPSFMKWILIGVGGLIAVIALVFVISLGIIALNPTGAAALIGYFRDVLISIFCLQGIFIVMAVGILIVQIARFVNLLRNETKPVTDQARETLATVRTSTTFVSKSVAEPLVAARSWFTGLKTFMQLVISIRSIQALFRKRDKPDVTE